MTIELVPTLLLMGTFFVLLFLRVPVALAMVVGAVAAGLYMGIPLPTLGQRMVGGLNSFPLLAIPLFILAGEIMGVGGIANRLIRLADLFVGWIRGGLAMLNVVSSTFFGGISGSAVADVSSIGTVMIPMMTKQGYHKDYSVAVTVSSAAQGVLIPPSHNMILYSLAAGGVSIGALFAAGLLPGLMLGGALLIATYITSRRRGYPKGEFVGVKEIPKILRDGLLGLLAPVIIIGGILSGIFTATESAAVACIYAMVITFGVYREIPLRAMGGIIQRSFYTLAVISFLIASASAFGYMLSLLRLPTAMTTALTGLTDNPFLILVIVLIIMLGFGLIMDMAPLILILTPILLPVVQAVGMDAVHFGVVLVFTLALGLITPPVGTVLFVGSAVSGASVESITKALFPFYIPMLIVLLLITFVPAFTLTLPGLVGF